MYNYTEQIKCDIVKIRIDIISKEKINGILSDMNFLNYRLGGVEWSKETDLTTSDLIWYKDEPIKSIEFEDGKIVIKGEWYEGEIQRILVSFIASKLYAAGRYLFHCSAVRYKDQTIMFMGGESNSGKTMSEIEACKRGATIVSTETLVTDYDGNVLLGSKNIFLKKRAKGTERIDKPDQHEGVSKFFNEQPEYKLYEEKTGIDLVVIPDIDGNYATVAGEMSEYEKEYQSFHCLNNYIGSDLLLASGIPMPLFDNTELRNKRAKFIKDFAKRRYLYIRGAGPTAIMDELDKLI
jgi:hypothetical protein